MSPRGVLNNQPLQKVFSVHTTFTLDDGGERDGFCSHLSAAEADPIIL